jgi:hypothetical protein
MRASYNRASACGPVIGGGEGAARDQCLAVFLLSLFAALMLVFVTVGCLVLGFLSSGRLVVTGEAASGRYWPGAVLVSMVFCANE